MVCFWRGNIAAKNKEKVFGMWILMGGIFLPKTLHLISLLVVQQFIYHQLKLKLPYTSSYLIFTRSQTIREH